MPRLLDLQCSECDFAVVDFFFMTVPDRIIHWGCGGEMEQVFLPRSRRHAQWSDRDAVVVFRQPNGQLRYPGRNDVQTPPGCERIVMRSLQEVNRFERRNGVVNEAMHYNNGNSIDSGLPVVKVPSQDERFANFLKSWKP